MLKGHDVRALAIRFADLWSVDPHQMVDEIYADDIEMEGMTNPARTILGSAQLHDVEDQLAARIPQHRHELVRVVVDGEVACLETMIVAPQTLEFVPACIWWWLDPDGRVAAEVGWFDWTDRTSDPSAAHGVVPPIQRCARPHPAAWGREIARRYVDGWSRDPAGTALDQFRSDATGGRVGDHVHAGVDAIRRSRHSVLDAHDGSPTTMELQRVACEGHVVALLVVVRDAVAQTRGSVVLTVDEDGAIVSERQYLDWDKALPHGAFTERVFVGSPHWTLRGG